MGDPIRPVREISITETPEFKAAVAEAARQAASEAAAMAVAQFSAAQGGANPSMDLQSFAQDLALAIAQMSHQGDKRDKPIDPKVLAARNAAHERMYVLIREALAMPKGDPRRPKWKTRSKLNLADHMIDPYRRDPATKKAVPVEFRWCLEPNDAMIPLNDLAEKIYVEFRASRGNRSEYTSGIRSEPKQPWFTDHGLLIEGAPPARREISQAFDEDNVIEVGEDPYDPNASHVHVLGTSHKAARQYNADNPI
jgi:hypothetical protein